MRVTQIVGPNAGYSVCVGERSLTFISSFATVCLRRNDSSRERLGSSASEKNAADNQRQSDRMEASQMFAQENDRKPRAHNWHDVHIHPGSCRPDEFYAPVEEEVGKDGRKNRNISDRQQAFLMQNDISAPIELHSIERRDSDYADDQGHCKKG